MVDTSSGKVLAQTEVIASKGISGWSLFWEADFFVQLIMLLLLAASVWAWGLIISKTKQLHALKKSTNAILKELPKIHSLSSLQSFFDHHPHHLMTRVLYTGVAEMKRSHSSAEAKRNAVDMVSQMLYGALHLEINVLQRNTGFLATVGSTAPFVGLLGTVWGIMHSFQSIAASQNTNLAVVAPGIAEALAATALGLLAAIPAVIAYNRINAFLQNYTQILENFADKICLLYSKEIY